MDYRPAEFVRFIAASESLDELVDEAKADAWVNGREHAVLILDGGEAALVRGGRDGIERSVGEGGALTVDAGGRQRRVVRLAWHTHPQVTGPSDHDRTLLDRLGQRSSVVYEIGGERGGTVFRGRGTGGRP